MAIQLTVKFGAFSICQLLILLCMNVSVNAVVVDPCQPQFPCVLHTKMGDPDNCLRYYECYYPEVRQPSKRNAIPGRLYSENMNLNDGKPRWKPKMCSRANQSYSVSEERCISSGDRTDHCQGRCKDGVNISLNTDFDQQRISVLEGTEVKFFCLFRNLMHGYLVPAEQFVWFLNAQQITGSGKQTVIRTNIRPDDEGFFNSTLTFASVTESDSGAVQCGVQYNDIFAAFTDKVYLNVSKKWSLTVSISPPSLTVFNNNKISLNCSANSDSYEMPDFEWFKDGIELVHGGDVFIEQTRYPRYSYLNTSVKSHNASVQFSCIGFIRDRYTERETAPDTVTVFVINETDLYCPTIIDEKHSITWTLTKAGTTSIQPCEQRKEYFRENVPKLLGMCSRKCELNINQSAVWLPANCDECVDSTYLELLKEIERLEAGIGLEDQKLVARSATKLATITNDPGGLRPGNLNASLEVISRLTSLRRGNPNIAVAKEEISSIVQSISNLLEPINNESWKILQTKNVTSPVVLLPSADVYGNILAKLSNEGKSKTISEISNNMVLEARQFDQMSSSETNTISFPFHTSRSDDDWITSRGDVISITTKSLQQICTSGNVVNLWSSYFRNLETYLHGGNDTDVIGSRVISLAVDSSREVESFLHPINITLHHIKESSGFMQKCVFWKNELSGKGYWDDSGCSMISTNDTHTFCQCNHLTNFAILFSRSPSADVALSIISKIGCSISVAALILTVIIYALSWKEAKSDQAAVLLNLCVALIVANIIFLVGADKISHQDGCKAVAVLLHYFFLAAFFLMLAEGVELLLYIVFVFHVRRKIETTMLIVSGWVLPLIVVAVSLGITKTDGYGDGGNQSCWLAVNNGLIWAFVGPALCIILINLIIVIVVLKRVSADRVPSSKDEKTNKIRGSMWNMAVICPVLGIAWVFGVLSVSFDYLVFQYIFAVANSCQGLFIFIFHVLLRKRKGKQGSMIMDLLCCGRFGNQSVSSTSGTNTAAKKT